MNIGMAQRTYAEKGTNQISEYALAPPGPKSLTHKYKYYFKMRNILFY